MSRHPASHQVVLIPGDGIGPEVTDAVRRILGAAGAPVEWVEGRAGLAALERGQDVLPRETMDANHAPPGRAQGAVHHADRRGVHLDQRAAAQGARSLRGGAAGAQPRRGAHRFSGVEPGDRAENTEGLYSGIEATLADGVVDHHQGGDREGVHAHRPLGLSATRGSAGARRHRLPQGQHHELTDGMFIRCARAVHDAEFAEIGYQEMIIDAGCNGARAGSHRFDLLLLENLYGDVLSDLGAGLVGGLGWLPGANHRRSVRGLRGGSRQVVEHHHRRTSKTRRVGEVPSRDVGADRGTASKTAH